MAQAASTANTAQDAFIEHTHSICPICLQVVQAQIVERQGQVVMVKHCPEHGRFEARIYGDAAMFQKIAPYDKPGIQSLEFSTQVRQGCPWDCGLCPEHRQHLCVGIIEVNNRCNLECPLCCADAGQTGNGESFELTYEQVDFMLERYIAIEGRPEVVQFSGGEPSLHPRILDFIALAKAKGISYVMLNTNGIRLAKDDRFLEELAKLRPHIYLQFDGFEAATYKKLRGRADLLEIKLRALERAAQADLRVVLVPVIEHGVNLHEVGSIVEYAIRHPAVFGISFQSAFHTQRSLPADPMQRVTAPDIIKALETQSSGLFVPADFIPIPCCSPRCGVATYAMLIEDQVVPIPRLLPVESYLDYIQNRTMPDLDRSLLRLLESLWSAGAQVGTEDTAIRIFTALGAQPLPGDGSLSADRCISCRVGLPLSQHNTLDLGRHIFMISIRDFMDPWTFDLRDIHKCCIAVLLPDGRAVPFCAYNSAGYRQSARDLAGQAAP